MDLLTEGKYAEMMVKRPKTGGDLVTWVWAMYFTAGLIGSSIAGPMSDNCMIREMFWIAVPFAAQVAIPALCKFFPERQLAAADRGRCCKRCASRSRTGDVRVATRSMDQMVAFSETVRLRPSHK